MQLSPCLAEAECSEFRLTRSRPPTKYGANPTEKIQAFLLKNSMIGHFRILLTHSPREHIIKGSMQKGGSVWNVSFC